MAGPKRGIQERLAGFPDLTTSIEDMFSAGDKSRRGLLGAERIPAHMAASRLLASRCECVTLPSGAAKTTRWQKSRRYRISSGFLNGSDILPKMAMRRSSRLLAADGERRRWSVPAQEAAHARS